MTDLIYRSVYSKWKFKKKKKHYHLLTRDGMGREEGSGWGTRVYLWWIHVDIWQNQYNIVKLNSKIKLNNNNNNNLKVKSYIFFSGNFSDISLEAAFQVALRELL